ncbi:MAG: nitronate monooxygenase [Clostridiales Family XIII bacterium]|jgi:NAD(P)H-dependent flavin oxidoreductase YrpB (nitropropane dioxygenase family)/DNA-binding MarR family transcriptional regulator|nr:nitronate monooxygenase [Clostridiales Family XIII bacterium]
MKNNTVRLNEILARLYRNVLKIEEEAICLATNNNLTINEIHTLTEIGLGKAKTMTQVAAEVKISVGALTTAMNKLVKKGYVRRFRVSEDRRMVKVELTEAGAAAVEEHERFHERMLEDIFTGKSEEEQQCLLRLMDELDEYFKMCLLRPVRKPEELGLSPIMLGELEIPFPVFQGDMGVAFSTPTLAAAIAANGGVGILTAVQPGIFEGDYGENPEAANIRALKDNIMRTRDMMGGAAGAGGRGAVAVSIPCALTSYAKLVRTAIEAGADIIVSGAGLPTALPGIVKDARVKLAPVVSSARAVGVLRRNWAKKYNRAPDAIIFEGANKSGHLGYKEEQLGSAAEHFYQTIIEIRRELEDLPNCPLIVADGLADKARLLNALRYGADGIQLEEEFIAAEECDAPESVKRIYTEGGGFKSVIVKSPLGMPVRIIRNKLAEAVISGGLPAMHCVSCLDTCAKTDIPFCLAEALASTALGDAENGVLFAAGNRSVNSVNFAAEAPPADGVQNRRRPRVEDIFRLLRDWTAVIQ